MRVLGIETSCDETGVAVYESERGLLGHPQEALFEVAVPHQPFSREPAIAGALSAALVGRSGAL